MVPIDREGGTATANGASADEMRVSTGQLADLAGSLHAEVGTFLDHLRAA